MSDTNKIDKEILEQVYDCSTICIFDDNFSVLNFNENFKTLTGYNENELSGINLLKMKYYDQSNSVYDFLIKTLQQGETWKGELQLNHKTRKLIWLDATIKPVTSGNHTNRYIANFIDISQRRQLIDNLKQRAHRQGLIAILGQISLNNIPMNDLLEQTLSVVCGSLNANTGLILEICANGKQALVRTAYNASHLNQGNTVLNIEQSNMLEYTLHSERPVICESLADEIRFNIPEEFLNENCSCAICILIGDKKYPFGILTLLCEKTKTLNEDEIHFLQSVSNILAEAINRHNMELALRHERELSRNYLDVAEVVFIVMDTKEKILLANRHAASILGYTQEELAGMNFINTFIPDNNRDTVKKYFHNFLNNETIKENIQNINGNIIPVVNKNNNIRQIRWRTSPLLNEHGKVNAILSAGEDITEILISEKEQKNLEEQLHKAQKVEAIAMLAGGIAHDFNNILASILGFSELAFEAIDKNDIKLHKYLTQIHNSGIKARDIIAQLQSINLQDDSPNKAILLPSMLKGTFQMLQSTLPETIDIQLNINNDLPAVKVNASKFNQMLMHLLTNSRNALQGKGKIKIKLDMNEISDTNCSACNAGIKGKYVTLSIHDNGPGIDKSKLSKLFSSNKTDVNSGLLFVNHMIHDSEGHLVISNSHLGEGPENPGNCIQLLFKIAEKSIVDKQPINDEVKISDINDKHIMVVDDENSVASYMGELFRGMGFNATVICDSVEALREFKNKPDSFDLIVSDQTMPVITGDKLAMQMLEIKPELPIIICTGHNDLLDEKSAKDLHIRALLKKPVDSGELLHTVVSLLTEIK